VTPPVPHGERGALTIADGAVAKLVTAAAAEVDGVAVPSARGLTGSRPARARVRRAGDRLDVELTLDVPYPSPVAAAAEAARHHVTTRTRELSGLTVARVDVAVSALVGTTDTGRVVA
jgi:uncharacterized alkaline shock family protein YloU